MDIDLEKSYLNYDLVNDSPIDYNQKSKRKLNKIIMGNAKLEKTQENILMV